MENLKIKVNNEAESKEAQELFFELGYSWKIKGREKDYLNIGSFTHLTTFDKYIGQGFGSVDHKKITMLELRDMVVLKRNNSSDANVCQGGEITCLYDLYLTSSNDLYFYHCGKNKWILSNLNGYEDYHKLLKPIEKEMKEYLDPRNGYKLIEAPESEALEPHASEWIEVPEGAEILSTCSDNEKLIFWKLGFNQVVGVDSEWDGNVCSYFEFKEAYPLSVVLWQRHTKPEELPFVDDEPKQTIENTLKERQGQYGSFEDVATVTQDLLGILQRTGFNSLPKPHKEALHMICSKMARLVNGDFNSIDGWHDIGGYAKLIEDIIKSEKV